MTRSLLSNIRVLILLVSSLWLLLAACEKRSNSPMIPGPITYVALGDSTGSGVGATEGGYVVRLFKRIATHRPDSKLINLCVSGATTAEVIVFDIYTVTHEQLASHPEYFSGDGFHPSDKGYELWAERMWPTIAQTIGADAETTGISH